MLLTKASFQAVWAPGLEMFALEELSVKQHITRLPLVGVVLYTYAERQVCVPRYLRQDDLQHTRRNGMMSFHCSLS
jgi:hypothetical protein